MRVHLLSLILSREAYGTTDRARTPLLIILVSVTGAGLVAYHFPYALAASLMVVAVALFLAPAQDASQVLSPVKMVAYTWLPTLGLSQLHWSGLESSLYPITYMCIGLAALAFVLGCALGNRAMTAPTAGQSLATEHSTSSSSIWDVRRAIIGMFGLFIICVAANGYAIQRFGSLPLFASDPDQARFILARELPGLIELLMALGKQVIVIGLVVVAVHRRALSRWGVTAVTIMCLTSALILLSEGGRLTLLVAIAVGGLAAFMASNASRWWFPAVVLAVVLPIVVVLPLLRETISYGGQYFQSLTEFSGGGGLHFLSYPYAALSFNIQNLQLVLQHPDLNAQFGGLLQYAPFDKLLHMLPESPSLPWHELLANWWVTGTALSTFYADFGWLGVVFESAAVGCLAMLSFRYAQRKRNELAWILYAYLAYVLAFTVYVWYPTRPEVYFDVAVFVAFSVFARRHHIGSAEVG